MCIHISTGIQSPTVTGLSCLDMSSQSSAGFNVRASLTAAMSTMLTNWGGCPWRRVWLNATSKPIAEQYSMPLVLVHVVGPHNWDV